MSHDRYGWKGDESPRLGLWEDQGISIGLEGRIGACSASSILLALEISTPWISSSPFFKDSSFRTMASQPRAGLSVPPEGLYLSLPPPGFLVVALVAPLVHGRFVSPLPRTSRRASLSDLHGRKVHLPRQYVSPWAGGDLRSSALMAMLPGIALPPCSLGRCSATKIRDPLAVGRVRTSRLIYNPSLHSSSRHPVARLQPPLDPWLAPYCYPTLPTPF